MAESGGTLFSELFKAVKSFKAVLFAGFVSGIFLPPLPAPAASAQNAGLFDAYVSRLNAAEPSARAQALARLGSLKDPAAVPHLLKALKDPSPFVRRQAADSLGLLRAVEAVPALGAVLERDPDIQARQTAALSLEAVGDKSAVPFFLKCLRDKEASVFVPCARALGNLRAEEAVKPLNRLLASPDEGVKAEVLAALGRIGSDEAYASVQSESGKKQGSREEEASVKAFGGFSRPGSAARFKRALASPNDRTKAAACSALAAAGDKSELSACAGLLANPDAGVRGAAARAVGVMGDGSAVVPLETALKDEKDAQAVQNMKFALESVKNRLKAGK
jgi:HEAT repeat protein